MKLPSSLWWRILQLWHLLFPIHLKPERYIISIFIKIIISWTVEVLKNSMSYVYGNLETDLAAAKKPRHSIASQAVILRLQRAKIKQKDSRFWLCKKKKKVRFWLIMILPDGESRYCSFRIFHISSQ